MNDIQKEELVFFRNNKFVFTIIKDIDLFNLQTIFFYEINSISEYSYILRAPVVEDINVKFLNGILYTDRFIPVIGIGLTKKYRLRVATKNTKYEISLDNHSTKLNMIFRYKDKDEYVRICNFYEADELMLNYTNYKVMKQINSDAKVIVVDYNITYSKDYTMELGSRININKPMLIRFKNMDLSVYEHITFSNIGNELSIVDFSKVSENLYNDIEYSFYSDVNNTILKKGVLLFNKDNDNDSFQNFVYEKVNSGTIFINPRAYYIDNLSDEYKEVKDFIYTYISLDEKDVSNYLVKTLLMKPKVIDFIRTHNGIWYI